MQIIGECKLCKENKQLQESHIIPKFVGKWLKKTSLSGHIRNVVKSSVRINDLHKDYLLCKSCENLFSQYETLFASKIFYPYHDQKKKLFHYDTWLQKFTISLNWRVAISGVNTNLTSDHPNYKDYKNTLEIWRKFLLGEIKNPGQNKNHILFIGIVDINDFYKVQTPQFNHDVNTKFLRSVDFATIVDDEDRIFIYSCIAGILLVSHIYPLSFKGWTSHSKIIKRGTLKNLQDNNDIIFARFLGQRIARMNELIEETLSKKQKDILNQLMTSDLEKTLKSKSLGLLNQVIKIESSQKS